MHVNMQLELKLDPRQVSFANKLLQSTSHNIDTTYDDRLVVHHAYFPDDKIAELIIYDGYPTPYLSAALLDGKTGKVLSVIEDDIKQLDGNYCFSFIENGCEHTYLLNVVAHEDAYEPDLPDDFDSML